MVDFGLRKIAEHCFSLFNRERQRLFDFLHDDAAFRLHRSRRLQQDVAQQCAICRHLVNPSLDQVIEIAGYKMALKHFRHVTRRGLRLLLSVV
jgi:hypothetical protein